MIRTSLVIRWVKFNAVGAMGILVQLGCLAALTRFGVNYLVATALAVEAAVVHNFFWHEHFTWVDRRDSSSRQAVIRFGKFNLAIGSFSIGGNVTLMWLFVAASHLPYLAANLLTIATCSLVNFLVSDRLVFCTAPNNQEHLPGHGR